MIEIYTLPLKQVGVSRQLQEEFVIWKFLSPPPIQVDRLSLAANLHHQRKCSSIRLSRSVTFCEYIYQATQNVRIYRNKIRLNKTKYSTEQNLMSRNLFFLYSQKLTLSTLRKKTYSQYSQKLTRWVGHFQCTES